MFGRIPSSGLIQSPLVSLSFFYCHFLMNFCVYDQRQKWILESDASRCVGQQEEERLLSKKKEREKFPFPSGIGSDSICCLCVVKQGTAERKRKWPIDSSIIERHVNGPSLLLLPSFESVF